MISNIAYVFSADDVLAISGYYGVFTIVFIKLTATPLSNIFNARPGSIEGIILIQSLHSGPY